MPHSGSLGVRAPPTTASAIPDVRKGLTGRTSCFSYYKGLLHKAGLPAGIRLEAVVVTYVVTGRHVIEGDLAYTQFESAAQPDRWYRGMFVPKRGKGAG